LFAGVFVLYCSSVGYFSSVVKVNSGSRLSAAIISNAILLFHRGKYHLMQVLL
jgi:hypothetical protein